MQLLDEVWADLASGKFPPLPTTVYPVWEAKDAIRTLSRGLHTGKLVLEVSLTSHCISATRAGVLTERLCMQAGGTGMAFFCS
jgi:hypothetical protein